MHTNFRFSALIFCNWTHFEFQDHIVVHKPKISVSNLALGGELSGIELVGGDDSSNVKCTVGYQVNKKRSLIQFDSWNKNLYHNFVN